MNNIPEVQNQQKQLERLAAQRELYSSAKRCQTAELVGSVLIPMLFTFAAVAFPNITSYSAMYGICFYVFDSLILEPLISRRRAKATKIQELFDCDVLQLEKSNFKIVTDITVEDVLKNYDAHKKIEANIEKIRDWYPKEVAALDISVARLICQRINYCWDSRLRSSYATVIKTVNIALVLILFIAFSIGRLGGEYLPLALSGLLPLFRFSIKQYQDNKESSEKLGKLNVYFDGLWQQILNGQLTEMRLAEIARKIQDEIYENRTKNPLIPDPFYNIHRNNDESLMSRTAESLVDEFMMKKG